ncbi:hypothetical protein ACLOJK_006815 [Asimina triloba]
MNKCTNHNRPAEHHNMVLHLPQQETHGSHRRRALIGRSDPGKRTAAPISSRSVNFIVIRPPSHRPNCGKQRPIESTITHHRITGHRPFKQHHKAFRPSSPFRMHQADLQWPAANPNRTHPIAPSGHEQGSSGRTSLATDGVPKLHPSGSNSWPTDPAVL